MRRLLPLTTLLLLLFSTQGLLGQGVDVPGFSADEREAAQGIGILGPSQVALGTEVTLRLTGTPPLDLTKPLLEQLGWLMGDSKMYCFAIVPGKPLEPLDVRGELVFSPAGVTMQPLVRFSVAVPGEHRLIVDWNSGQHQLVEHAINSGTQPDPEPSPNPPIPPLPAKSLTILVVEETAERTPEQFRTLSHIPLRQWLEANNHRLRVVDRDVVDESDSVPADLAPWLGRVSTVPWVFFVDDKGNLLHQQALPTTGEQLISLAKKYGAER